MVSHLKFEIVMRGFQMFTYYRWVYDVREKSICLDANPFIHKRDKIAVRCEMSTNSERTGVFLYAHTLVEATPVLFNNCLKYLPLSSLYLCCEHNDPAYYSPTSSVTSDQATVSASESNPKLFSLPVYDYFSVHGDKKSRNIICLSCNEAIKKSGGTTNLKKHLQESTHGFIQILLQMWVCFS